jgi:hypothetical protein
MRNASGLAILASLTVCTSLASATTSGLSVKPLLRPHAGPHGGTLVTVPGTASLEFVCDSAKGRLTAYILDRRGQPLRITQDALRLEVTLADVDGRPVDGPAARFSMELAALPVAPGSPQGGSEFAGVSPTLQGIPHFVATVENLSAGATVLRDIPFRYPGP